ncbi:hypothetical protein ACWFMI_24900 [Nocardiopsis terrae]|uniref:hypothetical protein n=1 Tax=Streptomyces sp. NPDC057554 TaxID=3350538 RepID=UPI0036857CFE
MSDRVSIEQFRARYGLPEGTTLALTPDGRRERAVWVPAATGTPDAWVYTGEATDGFRKVRPNEYRNAGKDAFDDLDRMEALGAEIIHATSTHHEDIADMLLAAAERMGPVRVITRHGNTVVFVPAPTTTTGPRFP